MKIGIIIGSDSDLPVIVECTEVLEKFGLEYELRILSAHRTPNEVAKWAEEAEERGVAVIIAAAGLAAALPGVVAAHTDLPVIGLPLASGPLVGLDALYSIVQMPPGVPVATVGINNARNAAYLALRILGVANPEHRLMVRNHRAEQTEKVLIKDSLLQEKGVKRYMEGKK